MPRFPLLAVVASAALSFIALVAARPAAAARCPVNHDQLTKVLKQSVKPSGGPSNGGFDNNEWAAAVDPNGVVCAVTFSGGKASDQWLGSRAIAAEKASTANALSLDNFAISTANLYAGAQPGGYLYGLSATHPVNPAVLYAGKPESYGTASDPFDGHVLGGVVTFGGGLALYDEQKKKVGAIGVSGDSSCADHNVAWRVRHALGLDHVPAGVSSKNNDAIIYDIMPDKMSASGYGHAKCKGQEANIAERIGAGIVPPWSKEMK
jgi:uncharacterized protein GlcG (DUF336 family)